MSLHKKGTRERLRQQLDVIEELADHMSDNGFLCPFAQCTYSIGGEDMYTLGPDGKKQLPYYCTLRGEYDRDGEYDESCEGAKDGKSCWLHHYGLTNAVPGKFRRITRRNIRAKKRRNDKAWNKFSADERAHGLLLTQLS